jgi:hypothetical protein
MNGPISARIGSRGGVLCRWVGVGERIAILVCFTMSSRFSAHEYDHRPLSSPRSLVDLSPSSHPRSRVRSGSLGAEDQRSSVRTVRAHNITRQNIHFQQLLIDRRRRLGPSFFSPHHLRQRRQRRRQQQPSPTCGVRQQMCDRPTHVLLPSLRLPRQLPTQVRADSKGPAFFLVCSSSVPRRRTICVRRTVRTS